MMHVHTLAKSVVRTLPYVGAAAIGMLLSPDATLAATNLPIDAPTNTLFTSAQGYGGPIMKLGALGVIGGLIARSAWTWGGSAAAVGAGAALGGLDQLVTPFSPTGSRAMTIAEMVAATSGMF